MSARLLRDRSNKSAFSIPNQTLINDYVSSNNSSFVAQATVNDPNAIIARPINENNQLDFFQQQQQKLVYAKQISGGLAPFNYNGVPGVGFRSLDALPRILLSLQCGIQSEVRWALSELARISVLSPQMLTLKNNQLLLELIVQHYVSTPFIKQEYQTRLGIPYLLQNTDKKIGLELVENSVDAALILRNLSQDNENASIISSNPSIKSTAVSILSCQIVKDALPLGDVYNSACKLVHYTIDLIESISSFIAPALKDDELFVTLIEFLNDTIDRSFKISIMRSLSRLMVRSKLPNKDGTGELYAADNVDGNLLDFICSCLIIESDPEFMVTALDFLYQYILPGGSRIINLLKDLSRSNLLISVIPRLLIYEIPLDSIRVDPEVINKPLTLLRRVEAPPPDQAKLLTKDLFDEVNKFEEPQRATIWMRCCYEANKSSDVTQISLWKSYENQFQNENQLKKLLPAVDFIKNVTNSFPEAAAMVITNPDNNSRKFIIKGIQPRSEPVGISTGNYEAINSVKKADKDDESEEKISEAVQNSVKFWKDAGTPQVSEIGKNTAMFVNGLMVQDKGKSLIKIMESNLIDVVLRVPGLYDQLVGTLTDIAEFQ